MTPSSAETTRIAPSSWAAPVPIPEGVTPEQLRAVALLTEAEQS
ncbi:hypothetical protein ACWDA9_14985 [Streptomyces sp. NPDC001193]